MKIITCLFKVRMLTMCALLMFCAEVSAQQLMFGMTRDGGLNNKGVPFQVFTDGSSYFSFHDFKGDDGEKPGNGARFAQISDQAFLSTGFSVKGFSGLTELGLPQKFGNRFDVHANQPGLIPPFRFTLNESIGIRPTGGLYTSPSGAFYMTPSIGGQDNGGTLLSVPNVFGNGATVLGTFDGPNAGRSPKGTPVMGANGQLYGTTEFGGTNDLGVIFTFSDILSSYGLRKIFDFDGTLSGANPTGNILLATDGMLYGMTSKGGTNNLGVIFTIRHDGTGYKKLADFNGTSMGANPFGSLVQFSDGRLYGMTSAGGTNGYGTIFSIGLDGTFQKIHDFNGSDGKTPLGDLLVDTVGTHMYGVALSGGLNDVGVLFKLENGTQFKKLRDFEARTGSHPVGTLNMERSEPRLFVEEPTDKIAYDVPFELSINLDHDMPVYFVSEDTTVVSVMNGKLNPKAPGETRVRVFLLGDYSHMPAQTLVHVRVKKRPQTITFDEMTSKAFGRDNTFEISFRSNSGLPVTIESSNTSIATVSGNVVSIRGGGFVDLVATQSGDDTYAEAKRVVRTLEISKADQTISFAPPSSIQCCNPIALQATSSSGLPVAFKVSDRSKLTIDQQSATPTGNGAVDIIAFQPGNQNYNAAEVRRTVTIEKGYTSIGFYLNSNTFTVGDEPYYSPPISPAGPVTVSSDPAGIAEYNDNDGSLYFLRAGTTAVTAKYPGSDKYYPSSATITITVKPRNTPGAGNVITWPATPETWFLSAKSFHLVASSSSGLPVTYTSTDPNVLRIEGNHVSVLKAGIGSIRVEQPGNDTLAAATSITRTFTVKKAEQSFYTPLDYLWVSSLPYNLPVTTNFGLPITYSITDSGIASIDNYYFTAKAAGQVAVTAYQPGNDDFLPLSKTFTVQIYGSNDEVFFSEIPKTLKVGDAPVSLKGYSPLGLSVTFSSSNQNAAAIFGSILTPVGAGIVIITAQSRSGGSTVGQASQYLTIEKGDQIISMAGIADKTFGDPSFVIAPESSAKLPVNVTTTTPEVVNIVGNRVSIVGTGTAKIIITQPGNLNYNAAKDHIEQFNVKDVATEFDIIGTVSAGGPNGSGVVYAMNSSGSGFRYLKQFDPKTSPSPTAGFIIGKDGYLYGTFRGGYNHGRIVKLNPNGTNPFTVHAFNGSEGAEPYGNLTQGPDDFLYGTTYSGGKSNGGIIFRVKPDGTAFKVIYEFTTLSGRSTKSGLTMASDGKLYGVTTYGGFGFGTLFSIKTDGTEFTILHQLDPQTGYDPTGELTEGPDGSLYGTLRSGALNDRGCVYRIKTNGDGFSTVLVFGLNPAGAFPDGGVQISAGVIYGVTGGGGTGGLGTIYSVNLDGTNAKQLFSFAEQSGSFPACKLAVGSDGKLYGAAYLGGTWGTGTIFSIAKNGSGFTKLADLDSRARYYQYGPLLEISSGLFLGGASGGGTFNSGALFTINTAKAFTIIETFPQGDQTPRQLVVDRKGEFYYGVTAAESWNQGGGIFRISADGSGYQQIYKIPVGETITTIFYCSTGHVWISGIKGDPISGAASGAFFRRLTTDGSQIQEISGYPTGMDYNSVATLTETSNGFVYGLANSYTKAFVFKVKNDGTGYTVLQTLENLNYPTGNILAASDGNLYFGSGQEGVFRINAVGQVVNIFKYPVTMVRSQRVFKIIELNGGRLGIATQGYGAEDAKPGINGAILSFEKDGTGYAPIFFPSNTMGGVAVDMIQSMDGWIFVANQTGFGGNGSIYKVRGDGSSYTPVRTFNGDDGANPVTVFFKKHQQTFSFDLLPECTPSTPAFLPVASSSSGAVIQFSSSNTDVAKIVDGRIVPLTKGSSMITATLPENANYYDGGSSARLLIVTRGTQTITFPEIAEKKITDSGFDIDASASSGLPLSFTSSDPSIASIDNLRVIIHKTGSVTITAAQNGTDDFFPAEIVSRTLVIVERTRQAISITTPTVKVMGDGPFTITASASSGLPVTLTSNSSNVSISGTTVSLLAPGTAAILATQAGDENFDPADAVQITFCVNPQKPGISSTGNYPEVVLHSTNTSGNAWYYNGSESAISYDRDLEPVQQGTYTVKTWVDGCTSETSNPYVLIATGVEVFQMEFEMYPNPVEDILNVKVSGEINAVEVANMIGNIVYRSNITTNTLVIDFTSFPSGIYLIKFASDNGIVVKKITKR